MGRGEERETIEGGKNAIDRDSEEEKLKKTR
jgi:hypothetical protein